MVFSPLLLLAAAFVAGLVDAVVGGGGLIQLPALFVTYPNAAPAMLLGTNRTSSIFGTSIAMLRYAREATIPWRTMLPAAVAAAAMSAVGAWTVTHVSSALFKPIVLAVLAAVAIYTFVRKDFGRIHAPKLAPARQIVVATAACAAIGFYDGFLGPGTGSFLIFAFIGLLGFSFLAASASAKVVNVATNFTSLMYFIATGHVMPLIGLAMAACNVAGSIVGTRLALARGSDFVRKLFLIVVPLVIVRFAYDIWMGR
jgi:uncharacterized membrane protein YfcA